MLNARENIYSRKVYLKWNSKEKTFRGDSLKILLRVLCLLGINVYESSNSTYLNFKIVSYFYPLYAHAFILYVTTVFLTHLMFDSSLFKTNVTQETLCCLSVLLWHVLYKRRKSLKDICKTFERLGIFSKKILYDSPRPYLIKSLMIMNFVFNLTCSVFVLTESKITDLYCVVFSYHKRTKCTEAFIKLIMFIIAVSFNFLASSFTNIISILYCALCYRCSVTLICFRNCLQKIQNSMDYFKLQNKLVRDYMELIHVIRIVQSVLSLPSLLILMISFMQAFIFLAKFMLGPARELTLFFLLEQICLHMSTGVFAFLVPFCCSQITRQMEKNKIAFHRICECIVFRHDMIATADNLKVLKTLYKISPITFSAYGMVKFSFSTVLAILGTLLTYGLLILNIKTV